MLYANPQRIPSGGSATSADPRRAEPALLNAHQPCAGRQQRLRVRWPAATVPGHNGSADPRRPPEARPRAEPAGPACNGCRRHHDPTTTLPARVKRSGRAAAREKRPSTTVICAASPTSAPATLARSPVSSDSTASVARLEFLDLIERHRRLAARDAPKEGCGLAAMTLVLGTAPAPRDLAAAMQRERAEVVQDADSGRTELDLLLSEPRRGARHVDDAGMRPSAHSSENEVVERRPRQSKPGEARALHRDDRVTGEIADAVDEVTYLAPGTRPPPTDSSFCQSSSGSAAAAIRRRPSLDPDWWLQVRAAPRR